MTRRFRTHVVGDDWGVQSFGPDFSRPEPAARPALARPITRVGATLIDYLVFIPIAVIVLDRSGLANRSSIPVAAYNRSLLIVLGCELAYEWVLIGWLGQTLGDMAVGIKVASSSTYGVPGFARSAVRIGTIAVLSLVPVVGAVAVLLCYLWVLWDPARQGLHDKVARTVVLDLRPRRYAAPTGRP